MSKFAQKIILMTLLNLASTASIHAADRTYRAPLYIAGQPTVTLHIFTPPNTPKGVLVALHGCGGLLSTNDKNGELLSARHAALAKFVTDLDWVAIFPDSFTFRGRREICTQKFAERTIKQSDRKADAIATLEWVKQQPWGPSGQQLKSVLLGWSNGGTTVLQTIEANSVVTKDHFSTNRQFDITKLVDRAVAFYPGCSRQLARSYQTQVPLTLFIGGKDDWTAPAPCIALGEKIGAQIFVYPEAHHGFDSPVGKVRLRKEIPNGVNPGQGVHVGPHKASREDAYAQLRILLDALSQ
jgi:dienelactone hydrolase